MANFNTDVNLSPNYGIKIEYNPKINTIQFGDGFEQRLTEGLNQNFRTIDLEFTNITESESDSLINFLNLRAINADSFVYTPPNDVVGNFVIDSNYRKTINYSNLATVTVVFREVFEP
jgi:phage-related protein